jgi:hypothetical protein
VKHTGLIIYDGMQPAKSHETRGSLFYEDTNAFLACLTNHTKSQRIEFEGPWVLIKKDFVDFLGHHAHSIRCLMFNDLMLCGSWSTTLRAIAKATAGKR